MASPQIENGYYLVARKLFESAIWRDDPHVLKLFLYLIGQARHHKKPKKYPGFVINKGELVTSLQEIAENNEYLNRQRPQRWSRQKVSRMLQHLEKKGYIKLLADTFGTHISICNYSRYQDPKAYKADRSGTTAELLRNDCGTAADINNNVNNGNNDKKTKYSDFVSLTEKEYQKLIQDFGEKTTREMIDTLDNYIGAMPKKRNKYTDHNRVLRGWVLKNLEEKYRRDLSKPEIDNTFLKGLKNG